MWYGSGPSHMDRVKLDVIVQACGKYLSGFVVLCGQRQFSPPQPALAMSSLDYPQEEPALEVFEDTAMAFLGAISWAECRHVHGQVVI